MGCSEMALPNLIETVYAETRKRISTFPCHSNRASSLGDDCERRLVYQRTRWEEAELHDVGLQRVFDEGHLQEKAVLRELTDARIELIEQQQSLEWKAYNITGHVDAVLAIDGDAVPVEIKSMSPYIFSAIAYRGAGVYEWQEVAAAFEKKPWLRRYLAQLTIYMLCKNCGHGMLILKDKSNGGLAQINVALDYEYAESLVTKAERINAHVDAGTMPDRIPYDPDVCSRCPYASLCVPDTIEGDPLRWLDDSLVEELLATREATAEARAGYEHADKKLKAWAKACEGTKLVVGEWLIQKHKHGKGTRVSVARLVADTEAGTLSPSLPASATEGANS